MTALFLASVCFGCSNEQAKQEPVRQQVQKNEVQQRPVHAKPELIEAKELCKSYDRNQASADKKYKGKRFRLKGKAGDKGTGLDHHYLYFEKDECGCNIKMIFAKTDDNYLELSVLDHGKSITVSGVVDGKDVGVINVKNCVLE